jgi:hypothetical protein
MENIYAGTASCPVGWHGKADDQFCFKVVLDKVSNEEACRYDFHLHFMSSHFGFVIFWQKYVGAKAAR